MESSVIAGVWYGEDRSLEIEFTSGETYVYREVPAEIVDALSEADSKGRAFRELILGKFPYVRTTEDEPGHCPKCGDDICVCEEERQLNANSPSNP